MVRSYDLHQHGWTIQYISKPQLLLFKHFYANRVSPVWNKLREIVVPLPTLNLFMNRLFEIN